MNRENNWEDLVEVIQERWNVLSTGEIIQSDGIPELASLISRKVGEPRPNVLHELVSLIRTENQDHLVLQNYFSNTSAARGDDIQSESTL